MDEETNFLDLVDLVDVEKTFMDNAIEKIEETTFDAFNFCNAIPGHGIQYMMYKLCHMYNFFTAFHFNEQRLINLAQEVSAPVMTNIDSERVLRGQPVPQPDAHSGQSARHALPHEHGEC